MIAEILLMATTVWFVPGWTRSQEPKEDVMSALTNAFPNARVEFKAWDGDNAVWPLAVESADKEVWRFAFEVAMMPNEERENVVEYVTPSNITERVSIDRTWAKSQFLKDFCNHHEIFYVNCLVLAMNEEGLSENTAELIR